MKKIILASLLLCMAAAGYAQESGKVTNRNIEKNRSVNSIVAYSNFILDMIRQMDITYGEYEEVIQRVWNKEIDLKLERSSAEPLKKMDKIKHEITYTPVYKGAEEYQKAVLAYADIVKKKITLLEKFGILGADKDSDVLAYNDAARVFYEANNDAIEGRNILKRKKNEFEKNAFDGRR